MNYSYDMYPSQQQYMDMGTGFTTMPAMYPHKQFVNKVENCAATCFNMMSKMVDKQDVRQREQQIKLLHDCARICQSQVVYTVVSSDFDRAHANFCASVCERCGNECLRFQDAESQNCARICLDCAEACRRHAGMM
ncbi:four-helix bundle copper-binding protein [Haloplasma contractile]|uniref:Ferredoxin protein n=1 Tax=Haloplasma contractile SSD-17B TaxID=1033810 RepID=F7PV23_9MOLU|nr:four-helix bundle copper-binding protein [Haloplasma contractile]ERJ11258.1 ferredoxin protein [Haloplasma contractile SSD-17B]